MSRKVQVIKRIWNLLNTLLITLVVLLAAALIGVQFVGLDVYVVLSGSMEPVYQTGSVIYVKEADTSTLKAGDVITYSLDEETVATHRIIEVMDIGGELAFRTKGDANDVEDGAPVVASQVLGTPIYTIPQLGYLVSYLHSESGRYATIAVGAVLLLLIILPDILLGEEKRSDNKIQENKKHDDEKSDITESDNEKIKEESNE